MTQFNAWPLGGGVWVGPVRRPRNSAREREGQHPRRRGCAEARFPRRHRRGLAAHGTVSAAATAHVRLALVGVGRPVAVFPLCNHRSRTRPMPRGCADATAERRRAHRSVDGASENRNGWQLNGSPRARRRTVVPTSARRCGSAFSCSGTGRTAHPLAAVGGTRVATACRHASRRGARRTPGSSPNRSMSTAARVRGASRCRRN